MKTIAAYTEPLSVPAGGRISLHVSIEDGSPWYGLKLVRLDCTDDHPDGPGLLEKVVPCAVDGPRQGMRQPVWPGSAGIACPHPALAGLEAFSAGVLAWPTLPGTRAQALVSTLTPDGTSGFTLELDVAGAPVLRIGTGSGAVDLVRGVPVRLREWTWLAVSVDPAAGTAHLVQQPLRRLARDERRAQVSAPLPQGIQVGSPAPLVLAAAPGSGKPATQRHYDGKLEAPVLLRRALGPEDLIALEQAPRHGADLVAAWDFARDMSSEIARDVGPHGLDARLLNLPARAMKGARFDGRCHDWTVDPSGHGAIHFHSDDLADAEWQADVVLDLPADLKSGVYAFRLENGADPEYAIFFVTPAVGAATAPVAYLASTATYMAYGNYRVMNKGDRYEAFNGHLLRLTPEDVFLNDHPELGDSLYHTHSDGSGVCYSSRHRPMLNMRPNTDRTMFGGDGYVTAWLSHLGQDFDVITDEDLHDRGADALAPYRVVVTGSHPEYWSTPMWDGLSAWLNRGGRLMYLGGNGFYWRIAFCPTRPGVIECRRAEDGGRPWVSEPGEYVMSFTGELGGMWRRQDRTPNELVGVGFTAQGFDIGSYYRRTADSFDPRVAFMFDGIGADELIGDFGLAVGGAAGLELDRFDLDLGSPPHALVVARSEQHNDTMLIANEDLVGTHLMLGGTENPLVRADMVFFETLNGGAVFSASSIAWPTALPCDGYANNVARLTTNVLRRFLDPVPF